MSAPAYHAQVFCVGGRQSESALVSTEVGGNKAANLSRLDRLGLRVPPAIVLGTAWCEEYFHRGGSLWRVGARGWWGRPVRPRRDRAGGVSGPLPDTGPDEGATG